MVHADAAEFESAITKALAAFDAINFDLCSLPGVENAFFDIFGTGDRSEHSHGGSFSFSAQQIARLAALNLAVDVSFSIFDRPNEGLAPHI